MRILYLTIIVSLFCINSNASGGNNDVRQPVNHPLSDTAFSKMVQNDITYAILGDNSPTSGIKFDLSELSGTINGTFPIKRNPSYLFDFSIKAGGTDQNFSILKGKDISTTFSFTPTLYRMIKGFNNAKYYKTNEFVIVKANNLVVEKKMNALKDTFNVVDILYNNHLKEVFEINSICKKAKGTQKRKSADEEIDLLSKNNYKSILLHFVSKIPEIDAEELEGMNVQEILDRIGQAKLLPYETDENNKVVCDDINIDPSTYYKEIVDFYIKYEKLNKSLENEIINSQIKNAADLWSQKNYHWFAFSPYIKTEKANLLDTLSYTFTDKHYLYGGLGVSYNYLKTAPEKVSMYFKVGVNVGYASNKDGISSFDYEFSDTLFSKPDSIAIEKSSGSAYYKHKFDEGFAANFTASIYILPLKSFYPGFYTSFDFKYNSLYNLSEFDGIKTEKLKIAWEAGAVFNINSKEKDKTNSILSISPYVGFNDISDIKRTKKTESSDPADKYIKGNLIFGLKLGVPIYLPKRK